jgi:biopolymer transport protein ExbD
MQNSIPAGRLGLGGNHWMSTAGRKRRQSLRPIYEINVAAFAAIMLALFAMFVLPGMWPLFSPKRGGSVDWPHVRRPHEMRGANRTDAIWITVERTGDIRLGNERVRPSGLAKGIRESLRNGAENKVYISADARAKYGAVREVLEAVRSAGLEKVAFLVWQSKTPYPTL